MKKFLTAVIVASCLVLSGCAVQKDLVPIGGSKSDGVVRLGYTYDMRFEKPVLNHEQGINAAAQRCKSWGYSNAEPFGGSTTSCAQMASMGCVVSNVVIEYQCTGI